MTLSISDIFAALAAAGFPTPELRRVHEKEQGPHRSATPESTHMQVTPITSAAQGPLNFIREGFVTFTPAQAALVLRECRYDRQRDETRAQAHIAALAEQMRRGLWLPKTQIDFARVGGRMVLVNGHHRMHAQIAAANNILWNVVVHDCANDAEVAALYWKFDTTIRKRSASNILDGIGFADDIGVSRTTARALWGAVPILALGLKMYRYQSDGASVGAMLPDERQEFARGYAPETVMADEMLRLAPPAVRKRMLVPSRFCMMLATLRHAPDTGRTFWRGLCEDDGLAKGDPRKTLLQDIQVRPNKPGLQAQHMMAIARAWNAYYEGRLTMTLKVTGNAVPVAGTPLTVRA